MNMDIAPSLYIPFSELSHESDFVAPKRENEKIKDWYKEALNTVYRGVAERNGIDSNATVESLKQSDYLDDIKIGKIIPKISPSDLTQIFAARQVHFEELFFNTFGHEINKQGTGNLSINDEQEALTISKDEAMAKYYEEEYARAKKSSELVAQMKLNESGYLDLNIKPDDTKQHYEEVNFYYTSPERKTKLLEDFNLLKITLRNMRTDTDRRDGYEATVPFFIAFSLDAVTRARK
jgi:hypothetical protein